MSGIVGFIGLENKNLLDSMSKELVRENSKKVSTETGKNFCLSSIDSCLISNEEGDVFLIFSGDIFNYDTPEVIIQLYEEERISSLSELNGTFCFALLDTNKERLILGRDQLGVKSLYYSFVNDVLFFSSEIKALLQNEELEREINNEALYHFLRFTFFINDETAFKNIFRVPPGSLLIYEKGAFKTQKYREIKLKINLNSEEFYIEKLLALLKESVKIRLQDDTSVGSLLSGGVDSSSITAILCGATDQEVKTFCVGFENNEDDLNNARFVSEYLGTDHREIIIKADEIKLLPQLIREIDEPLINSIPSYKAFNIAKKSVDNVFLGRGGDELFGGYSRFRFIDLVDKLYSNKVLYSLSYLFSTGSRILLNINESLRQDRDIKWDKTKKIMLSLSKLDNKTLFYISVTPSFIGDEINKIVSKDVLTIAYKKAHDIFAPYFVGKDKFLNQALLAEIKIKLVNDILLLDDRMATSNGINEYMPLLDMNLVDFAFTIPANLKIRGDSRKYVLRKAISRLLPKEIIERPKGGQFSMNSFTCFEAGLKDYASNFLLDTPVISKISLHREKTRKYIQKIVNKSPSPKLRYHYDLIMALIGIDLWYKIYIEGGKPELIF